MLVSQEESGRAERKAFEGMDTTAYLVINSFHHHHHHHLLLLLHLHHYHKKKKKKQPIWCWNETGFDLHITSRMVDPDGGWIKFQGPGLSRNDLNDEFKLGDKEIYGKLGKGRSQEGNFISIK